MRPLNVAVFILCIFVVLAIWAVVLQVRARNLSTSNESVVVGVTPMASEGLAMDNFAKSSELMLDIEGVKFFDMTISDFSQEGTLIQKDGKIYYVGPEDFRWLLAILWNTHRSEWNLGKGEIKPEDIVMNSE